MHSHLKSRGLGQSQAGQAGALLVGPASISPGQRPRACWAKAGPARGKILESKKLALEKVILVKENMKALEEDCLEDSEVIAPHSEIPTDENAMARVLQLLARNPEVLYHFDQLFIQDDA
ncbi:hypothetical protein BT96DRAFT_948722 [Gymnopus androsaceus JB14]|uniref:Uncharacterized protein n=1 Tax=Gymnopus androsaceus JB14 TaxID=1447944 RepID=A0A6A4GML5_9AGAR|nr:hypothetical protein BT96DRAFT_948722 [Gymnopus androsaceus JB14]